MNMKKTLAEMRKKKELKYPGLETIPGSYEDVNGKIEFVPSNTIIVRANPTEKDFVKSFAPKEESFMNKCVNAFEGIGAAIIAGIMAVIALAILAGCLAFVYIVAKWLVTVFG
jgi:hypothetical protein